MDCKCPIVLSKTCNDVFLNDTISNKLCDHQVSPDGGTVQLASSPASSSRQLGGVAGETAELCVGVHNGTRETDLPPLSSVSTPALGLVACDSPSALVYNVATGQLSPRGARSECATVVQRTWRDATTPGMTLSACEAAPSETQQFQFNPATGALRPKASVCIATSVGSSTRVAYRDCCIALCPTSTER
jgi:hypothetical protein